MKFAYGVDVSIKAIIIYILLSMFLSLGFISVHYKHQYDQAAKDLKSANKLLIETNNKMSAQQKLYDQLSYSDAVHTKRLDDEISQNNILRGKLASGSRVFTKGKCATERKHASSSPLGNVASVELSRAAGQNILSIREGLIRDKEKILYLQDYAKACYARY